MSDEKLSDILLVEDNLVDIMMCKEAFAELGLGATLHVAENGEEALRFLRRGAGFENAPRPSLVLLDINLPGKNGFEVLTELKADAALRAIPVIVLTSSEAEKDVKT